MKAAVAPRDAFDHNNGRFAANLAGWDFGFRFHGRSDLTDLVSGSSAVFHRVLLEEV